MQMRLTAKGAKKAQKTQNASLSNVSRQDAEAQRKIITNYELRITNEMWGILNIQQNYNICTTVETTYMGVFLKILQNWEIMTNECVNHKDY